MVYIGIDLHRKRSQVAAPPELVAAARASAEELEIGDPFGPAVESMLATASGLVGPQQGSMLTLAAFSEMDDSDRTVARSIIFGMAKST